MSVVVLVSVVLMCVCVLVCAGPQCVLLNLAKKQKSIVGHKECVEGSIAGPCEGQSGDQWQPLSH